VDPVLLANQQVLMALKGWLITQPGIYQARFVESADHLPAKSTTYCGPAPHLTLRVAGEGGATT
jgi:hypothetical protein